MYRLLPFKKYHLEEKNIISLFIKMLLNILHFIIKIINIHYYE